MNKDREQDDMAADRIDPMKMLPGEDVREHLERLHKLGLLKFKPGCPRCNDHGCIACYP